MKIREEIMLFILKEYNRWKTHVRNIWLFKKYDHWKENKISKGLNIIERE